jgi:RimJ/RimL family protein N-acetyltransferase
MQVFQETGRLILRRLVAADLAHLCALDADPAVMRFLTGGTPTPCEVIRDDILPRFLRSYEDGEGYGYWAAIVRATGEFAGWFSLRPRGAAYPDEATLGYRLRRAVWGRGYATEGANALIRKGFADVGLRRIAATTYQDNLASRRVLEKIGMAFVRSFRLTPDDLAAPGTFHVADPVAWDGDDVEYALTREEWERQQCGNVRPG